MQGDILGIVDAAGNLVVEYKYDAWCKPISTTGSKADTLGRRNPFRYRGYVWGEVTALHYLRSRYYEAHSARFLNSDTMVGKGVAIDAGIGINEVSLGVSHSKSSGRTTTTTYGKFIVKTTTVIVIIAIAVSGGCIYMAVPVTVAIPVGA